MNNLLWVGVAGLGLYLLTKKAKTDETAAGGAPESPDMGSGGGWYGDGGGGGVDYIEPVGVDDGAGAGGFTVLPGVKFDPDGGRDEWIAPSISSNQLRLAPFIQSGLSALEASKEDDDPTRAWFKKKSVVEDEDDDDGRYSAPRANVTPPKPGPVAPRLLPTSQVQRAVSVPRPAQVQTVAAMNAPKAAGVPLEPKTEPTRIVRTQITPVAKPEPQIETKPKTTALLRQIEPSKMTASAMTRVSTRAIAPAMTRVSTPTAPKVVRILGGLR